MYEVKLPSGYPVSTKPLFGLQDQQYHLLGWRDGSGVQSVYYSSRRTWAQFPALTSGSSQMPVTLAPENPTSLASGVPYTHGIYTHIYTTWLKVELILGPNFSCLAWLRREPMKPVGTVGMPVSLEFSKWRQEDWGLKTIRGFAARSLSPWDLVSKHRHYTHTPGRVGWGWGVGLVILILTTPTPVKTVYEQHCRARHEPRQCPCYIS